MKVRMIARRKAFKPNGVAGTSPLCRDLGEESLRGDHLGAEAGLVSTDEMQ